VPVGDSSLAARACEVLASMKGAQPVPVRQLAQMMKKRRLVEADPEVMWRPLKSALLADSQRRAAAGLPPRVSYRGRDLFAYRPGANAELEAAEAGLESAAHRLRGATERALAARLVELPLPVLEQVVQLYLVQAGWRDIEWIKRVDRSGYAVASEPGEGGKIMVAARAGNQEVDRRGIGELRAGVAAKNLVRGHLIAPRELGSEARAELEREGRPVSALCGLRWTAALVDAGIGVAQRAMPVAYLDPELFDRLGEG
jgi:predicted Rdx family selenoprotein